MEPSLNRISGRNKKLERAFPKSMLLVICILGLAPIITAALSGCDRATPPTSLPVTDLSADNVIRVDTDIGFGMIKWGPNGKMLFYRSGDWLCAARADGTCIEKLVEVSSRDIFNTSEDKLLYTRTISPQTEDEVQWQVYEMGLSSKESRKIGELDVAGYNSSAWSPDGARIFYTTRVGEEEKAFIWDLSTNETSLICTLPGKPAGFTMENRPSWSPDGKYIAWYQLVNLNQDSEGIIPGDIFIILIDIEKGECTELAQIDGLPYSSISWSPDSKMLMYAESVLQSDPYLTSLRTVDIHGDKQQITSMPDKHMCGFFGPDRGKVTCISYDLACMRVIRNVTFRAATPGDGTQISILDIDGTEEQRLLDLPCTEGVVLPEYLAWSNDRVNLAFVCMVNSESPHTDIYVLNVPSGF